jgi:hypothetical protein
MIGFGERKIVCRGGLVRAARNGSIDPGPHSSDKTNFIDRIGEPVAQNVKGSRASGMPRTKKQSLCGGNKVVPFHSELHPAVRDAEAAPCGELAEREPDPSNGDDPVRVRWLDHLPQPFLSCLSIE